MIYTRENIRNKALVKQILDKVEILNKKARKLGVDELSVIVDTYDVWEHPVIDGMRYDGLPKIKKTRYRVTIKGEPVRLKGWTFVARIESRDGGNLIKSMPGEEGLHQKYGEVTTRRCDHCGHKRLRNVVYIVRDESGKEVVVGSSCLKDFLGGHPEKALWAWESWDKFVKDWDEMGSGFDMLVEPLIAVAVTYAIAKKEGWCSRKSAMMQFNKTSTAEKVENWLWPPKFYNEEDKKDFADWKSKFEFGEKHIEKAQEILEWLDNYDDNSDYVNNLRTLAKSGALSPYDLSLFCSLIGAWQRATDIELGEKSKRLNDWFGEEGIRYKSQPLVFKKAIPYESMWNSGIRVVFNDEQGREFVWFTSSYPQFEVDQKIMVSFTVKKHSIWNDFKNTVINRVKEV